MPSPKGKAKETREALTRNDWIAIAERIVSMKELRKSRRRHRELQWDEIDRQIDMVPIPREKTDGDGLDWLPEMELPLQFNTLEVLAADSRSLIFPRDTSWYKVSAQISEEYAARFDRDDRRKQFVEAIPTLGREGGTPELDRKVANALVKTAIDHYHRLYDFRGSIDQLIIEAIKYGTFVGRVREVSLTQFSHEARSVSTKQIIGPAVIPCSIKNTYLDDTTSAVMHEGVMTTPSIIRSTFHNLEDILRSAKIGGASRGWMLSRVRNLEPKSEQDVHAGQVELLEYEGDFIHATSRSRILLPNVLMTVAVAGQQAEVVRFRTNEMASRSYVSGAYMRHNVDSPYGTSPLMQGQPIQEGATASFTNLMVGGALNALPPIVYDKFDPALRATGGPAIHPGAKIGAEAVDRIAALKLSSPADLLNVYLALLKQFEDTTGVNDPRRGAQARSHTSATGSQIEATKGLARTEDFVTGMEDGAITTMLYLEYDIIKRVMTKQQSVSVGAAGIEGFVNMSAADLPDEVVFKVHGSAGIVEKQEKRQNFIQAIQMIFQIQQLATQFGISLNMDIDAMAQEVGEQFGVQNISKFISPADGVPESPAGGPPVQGSAGGGAGAAPPQLAQSVG